MAQATLGTTYSSEETRPHPANGATCRGPVGCAAINQAIDDVLRDYTDPLESLRRALKSGRDRPLTTPRMYSRITAAGVIEEGVGSPQLWRSALDMAARRLTKSTGHLQGRADARGSSERTALAIWTQCMTATILIMAISFGALVMLYALGVNLFLRAQDTDGNSFVHRIGPTVKPLYHAFFDWVGSTRTMVPRTSMNGFM